MIIDRTGKGVLLCVASMTVLAGAIIAPSLPFIVDHLIEDGIDPQRAAFWGKMLLSIPALMILLCSPLMGYCIDRFGRRMILLLGLIIFACTGVWGGVHPHLIPLIISRVGLGIAVSMSMTTAITLVTDYFSGHAREQFMGYVSTAMGIGGITYFILGGFVATVHWRLPFFMYLLAIPAFFLAYKHLPEPVLSTRAPKTSVLTKGSIPYALIGMLYVTATLNMAVYYIIPTQLPFVLKELGYISPLHVGLTTSACSAAGAFMAFRYGALKKRFSHPFIFAVAFFLIGMGYCGLFYVQSYGGVIVGLVCAGTGFGMVMPNTGVWLMRTIPENMRGRVSGGLSSSINIGQFLSPIMSTYVIATAPMIGSFGFFGAVCFALSLFYAAFLMPYQRAEQSL